MAENLEMRAGESTKLASEFKESSISADYPYSLNEDVGYEGLILLKEGGLQGPTSIKYWM